MSDSLDHGAVGARISEQVHQFDRHASSEHLLERKKRPSPLMGDHEGVWGSKNSKGNYIDPPSAHEHQVGDWLTGRADKSQGITKPIKHTNLFWSYKNTPHAPASVFLKYLVHRVNNVDLYDDHAAGHKADVDFLKLHQQGEAAEKNGHLTPDDLHNWTRRWAPTVIPQLLERKAHTQRIIRSGCGMNVRDIGGEPYVALTRGLHGDMMNREHTLSSWSDRVHSGFGSHQHRAWVPLKDIWHAYDFATNYESDTLGSEDEFLLSNTGHRYEAGPEDVKASRIKSAWGSDGKQESFPLEGHLDTATDEQVAHAIRVMAPSPQSLLQHPNLGPKSHEALASIGWHSAGLHPLASTPREKVMAEATPTSGTGFTSKTFQNPNLTTDDLKELSNRALQMSSPQTREGLALGLVESPKADSSVVEHMWNAGASSRPEMAAHLLTSPLATRKMFDDVLAILDKHPARLAPGFGAVTRVDDLAKQGLAAAVLENPHHPEDVADKLVEWSFRTGLGLYNSPGANLSLDFLKKLGHASNTGQMEGAEDKSGEVVKRDTNHIVGGYVARNPRAKGEYISALLNLGYVDPYYIGQRILAFLPIPHEAQVPAISKLMKGTDINAPSSPYRSTLENIALAKGLTQEAVNLLAHCQNPEVRHRLYLNKTVSPEMLEAAWPKGLSRPQTFFPDQADLASLEESFKGIKWMADTNQDVDPFHHLNLAIAARQAYAARRAREHLIKPFPADMAKSEAAWAIELRNWVAQAESQEGWYYPCTQDVADDAMHHNLLHPTPTEDLLDGEAVFAHRASPEFVKKWQKTAAPGDALVYFETNVAPEKYEDGRVYWTGIVPLEHAHVVEPGMSIEKHEELTGLGRVLAKMHGPVTFPKLGIPDDRRESDIISNGLQLERHARAFAQQDVNELRGKVGAADAEVRGRRDASNPKVAPAIRGSVTSAVSKGKGPGMASEFGGGYVLKPSPWAGHSMPLEATKPHEDMHLLLNRVQAKYGREGRKKLVANLFEALPSDLRDDVMSIGADRAGKGARNPMSGLHEEWLTYLISYLNARSERKAVHGSTLEGRGAGDRPGANETREFHDRMKRAYKAVHAAAQVSTPAWTQHFRPWLVRANNPPGTQIDFADTRGPFGQYAHTQDNLWEDNSKPQSRLWTGQFVSKSEQGGDDMKKTFNLKGLALAGALALAPAAAGAPSVPPAKAQTYVKKKVDIVEPLHQHLKAIRTLESSDGRDTAHHFNVDEYNTAFGDLGLKPVTAHDQWRRDPALKAKYPGLEQTNTFTKAFKAMPGLYNACANGHWKFLLKGFGNNAKTAAYAWRWGAGAAAAALRNGGVEHDDYVQKFAAHPASGLSKKPVVRKNETGALEPGEAKAAMAQLGHNPQVDKVLQAVVFLTGRHIKVDEAAFSLALQVHDGDIERAALYSVGLDANDKNLKALQAVLRLGSWDEQTPMELTKAETEAQVAPITSVQPAVPDAEDTADAVGRAVTAGTLQALKLKGKHAAGATAAKDPQTGYVFLLKPGSGKQSPAAGSRDDKSSQSAREAAFYHVAKACGLGNYYPRCDLLIVNAQEWAAMQMLGSKWKGLDEYNRSEDGRGREVLTPYLKRGDIHRLAAMDWILGNPDSHGQNIMTHAESVALIDHGSAFAGPGFNPGLDTKSFIPYYLRLFGSRGMSKLSPEERVKSLPVLDADTDTYLRDWVSGLVPSTIDGIMEEYGIGEVARTAVLNRLHDLQSTEAPNLSAYLDALWAGIKPEMKKSEPLAKHTPESLNYYPIDQMTENGENYKWPVDFHDPKEVATRRQTAKHDFLERWLNNLREMAAYKKWHKDRGGTPVWRVNPKTGKSAMTTAHPEVKDQMARETKLMAGKYQPAIDWARRTIGSKTWSKVHEKGLAEAMKRAEVEPRQRALNTEGEVLFWLDHISEDPSLLRKVKDPVLRRKWRKSDYRFLDTFAAQPMEKQKAIIRAVVPEAFTKRDQYSKLYSEAHPELVSGIQHGTITMNFPVQNLPQMTRAGKYLNLHETGAGMGENEKSTRGAFEQQNFGIPEDVYGSMRPVYGAVNWAPKVHSAHAHYGAAPQYGNTAFLELKPHVKERVSYTPGDSFEVGPEQVFGPQQAVELAHAHQASNNHISHALVHGRGDSRWSDYIEAQVFGGVNFSEDVQALHLTPALHGVRLDDQKSESKKGQGNYEKYIAQARAFGAKHQVHVYLHLPAGSPKEYDECDMRKAYKHNAFDVVKLYTPGEKFKPPKGVTVEEDVQYSREDDDDGYGGDQTYDDGPGGYSAAAKALGAHEVVSKEMKEHYKKHLPKLTAAYNALPEGPEKKAVADNDSSYGLLIDKAARNEAEAHPFTAWARTIVPEFGKGYSWDVGEKAAGLTSPEKTLTPHPDVPGAFVHPEGAFTPSEETKKLLGMKSTKAGG